MQWSDFYDGFWDWSDSTRRTRISSLEDVGSGDEVVDAIYEIEDFKIRAQLIRKVIKLGAKFTTDDFQNLEGELPDDVYAELGRYAGFDADNPTYDKLDSSWSHFYDNFTEWDPATQTAAINNLKQMGKRDEVVDAILILEDKQQRALLARKAIASKVKFNHEDFENLQDELPDEVYRELAAYTGHSVDCPDYDKDNRTWKYFYENCGGWTEQIQLAAIASLKTFGGQKQVMEAVLELDAEAPKVALIEQAIKRNIVFSKESLQELEGDIPIPLFQKLLKMAGIPDDDLYFDEDNMTWDDFECSYSAWSEELLAKRIGKLKDFGDPESVCEVIQCMPTSELEDALYERAVKKGVKFTEEQLENMGHIEHQLKNALDNFLTDEQIDQMVADVSALNDQLDEQYPDGVPSELKKTSAWGVIGAIFAVIFGFFYVVFGVIFGLSKKYDSKRYSSGSWSKLGRQLTKQSKKKSNHCDGDCTNCPPHYGYRYGRWYYGHGHQYGCQRGGNGGASGRTYRD